jgi:DNA polymerase-3 subunit gamma/tau
MASQSLYRKWRSQTFSELVGQEHVVQTLRNAVAEDRVGHAYIFTGPRGVGKTSMARLLAKAVNCLAPLGQRPCGTCESCRSIADNRAVDIIEMDAASHTSVDDARDLIERVQFRPTSSRYKVYVIDEVHMLSTAAFNALLKTLEEPPDHAIFILATTEIHKVPATILSRCQRFTFVRHSINQIATHLHQIAASEGLTLEDAAAQGIARAATGSMRDALGMLEQIGSFASGGTIRAEQVQGLLGTTTASEVDHLIDTLLSDDITAALRITNGIADQGADMRQFVRDLVDRLRALLLLVTTNDAALVDVSADEQERLAAWAAQTDAGRLVHLIRLLSGLDYALRTSPYGHLPLELALVEALVAPAPTAAPAPIADRSAAAPARREGAPKPRPSKAKAPAAPAPPPKAEAPAAPAPPPKAEAPAAPAPPDMPEEPPELRDVPPDADLRDAPPDADLRDAPPAPPPDKPEKPRRKAAPSERPQAEIEAVSNELSALEQVEAVWADVVRDVRPFDNKLQAMLRDVHPVDVEGSTVILLAKYPFHKGQIERHASRRILEDVLSQHLGNRYAVQCTLQEQAPADTTRSQLRNARNDPHIKAARNIFGAEIVDIIEGDPGTPAASGDS